MKRFLRDNGKYILAVVSVLLMVAWAVPAGLKNRGAGGDAVVGYMGKEKVYAVEKYNAKNDWELLEKVKAPMQRADGRMGSQSLGSVLVTPMCAAQIQAHPEVFLLLQKEAQKLGVQVSPGDVEDVMQHYVGKVDDEIKEEQFRRAISNALLVRNGLMRAASVIKVSEPMRERALATNEQAIAVSAVTFDASSFAAKTPAPTTQQAGEQFNKYRDTIAGAASASNPFGFGYKYPDRVKLQYIALPRAEVRRAVEAKKDARRWDVDSYKFYSQHQDQFPTTQKGATTRQAFSLETPATTRPFAEVKGEIKSYLIDRETTTVQSQINDLITQHLSADYTAWHRAASTSQASTAPVAAAATAPAAAPQSAAASSLNVAYDTFDYLKALAAKVQAQTGVLPTVVSLSDRFMTVDEVGKIKGLGEASGGAETLAGYLESSVAAFLKADAKTERSSILHRQQPSQLLMDDMANFYVLRITDADPSHPPVTMAEVAAQVQADWVKEHAYGIAKEMAQKLVLEAKVGGLKRAAAAGGQRVIATEAFKNEPGAKVGGMPLDGEAKKAFVEGAFKLLSTPPAHPGAQPIRIVELPTDGKAVVTELADVQPSYDAMTRSAYAQRAAARAGMEEVGKFIMSWFNYDAIVARMDYKAVANEEEKEPNAPLPTEPPIF